LGRKKVVAPYGNLDATHGNLVGTSKKETKKDLFRLKIENHRNLVKNEVIGRP
jgi:hypothetical protein